MEKIKRNGSKLVFIAVIALVCSWAMLGNAGSLNPSAPPAPTMKTLDEIYTKIDTIEADARTSIKSSDLPLTISQSGSYYLSETINFATQDTTGITITASDVTIDLNGYALIGPGKTTGSSGSGISASGKQITVLNGSVSQWRGSGVALSSSSQVSNIKSTNNGNYGVQVGQDSRVKDCILESNGGDGIDTSNGCVISGCTARSNSGSGYNLGHGSSITNSSASYNSGYEGIGCSRNCSISNCSVSYNNDVGIYGSSGTTIVNCSVVENGGYGIDVSNGSVVSNCAVRNHSDIGILASNSLVIGNASYSNSPNMSLTSCTSVNNHAP